MNPLRKLAGQTAIYGLSSIVGRLLNYLLVPLHTRAFSPEQFGVVTEMYSYVAFLLVVLTYGFETAFFRFAQQKEHRQSVYSTALVSLLVSSFGFFLICWIFAQPLAELIRYGNHPEYILWFALILATDAATAIPFSKLRLENKAYRFAFLRLVNIAINILLNVFFIWLCPYLLEHGSPQTREWINIIYNPAIGVGYVFLANLISSLVTFFMLVPEMVQALKKESGPLRFDRLRWKEMMIYSFPLLIGGLAGITNEMFSRVSLKYQLPAERAMHDLGVFGACYKVAILMTIFIQTFRFAAEPFFFSHAAHKDARQIYASVMNWFVITCSIIYLVVMLFMHLIRHFIGENFHEGLHIVPILLLANMFLGIYYNLSIWFKLNDKTRLGAWMTIGGALLTIALNYWWIPRYGYLGASWATFVVYLLMMVCSYLLGQKYYPVPYQLFKLIAIPVIAVVLAGMNSILPEGNSLWGWTIRLMLVLIFSAGVVFPEIRKKNVISPP
jgi:O-antigen/teichoic acid export membrane protein